MPKKLTSLTSTPAWQKLEAHQGEMAGKSMRALFDGHQDRFKHFSLTIGDFLLDYSKNLATAKTMDLLMSLARQEDVEGWRSRMFAGEHINTTEDRAVLHTALRHRASSAVMADGEDVMQNVRKALDRMRAFSQAVRDGGWKGHTGEAITDVVNIGIGGSDLGPAMVCEALNPYHKPGLRSHFVSNVDGTHMSETLKPLHPATTLFIVASKTFTTQETMSNANAARDWIVKALGEKAVPRHFVALSANEGAVMEFGIEKQNMFLFWDWVGGRFSLWSSIGLSIAIAIGIKHFEEMLDGAFAMDRHFQDAPLNANMPIILALIGIWNSNFLGAHVHAVLPYDQNLRRLPAYLQQADMESNGKGVTLDGHQITDYHTGPVIFGEPGNNAQHAFFQLIHQGTRLIASDFIASAESHNDDQKRHAILLANFFAQTEALMLGKSDKKAPHRNFTGNRPTNSIMMRKLTPRNLGMLIALYEHKIFVQGVIWRINSFDQWGVELGKQLAKNILPQLTGTDAVNSHDSSTNGLINHYKHLTGGAP